VLIILLHFICIITCFTEFTHAMIRETRKHEDEQQTAKLKIEKLADDLARASSERAINETKLSELDHLVGQLLSVNESLLHQLSGKPQVRTTKKTAASAAAKLGSSSPSTSGTKTKTTSSKTASSKISKLLKADAGSVDVGQLTGMHEMYKTLAKSIVGGETSSKKSSEAKTKKKTTRMSKKKSETKLKPDVSAASASVTTSTSGGGKKVNIRLPSTNSVSYDFDNSIVDCSYGEAEPSTSEYQDVVSSLEAEFDELNDQYRHLLSSASVPTVKNTSATETFRSDQLVDVIQKLHRKGEQLRAVKTPPRPTRGETR
jgi:hypothetical protein